MSKTNLKFDSGIKFNHLKYREFGKLILNFTMLNNDNKLACKYKSGAGLVGLRKQTISEDFKSVINELITNGKVDYPVAKQMNDNEKVLLGTLIIKAGLGPQLKFNIKQLNCTVPELKAQFTIIQGEVISGNDSKELKQQAYDIVTKLLALKGIDEEDGQDLLNELKPN